MPIRDLQPYVRYIQGAATGITFLERVKSGRRVIPAASAKAQHMREPPQLFGVPAFSARVALALVGPHAVSRGRADRVPTTPGAPNLARDISAGPQYFFSPVPSPSAYTHTLSVALLTV